MLKNIKLLDLEGFNIKFGWHTYLSKQKHKINKEFKNYYIRHSFINTWDKYRNFLEKFTPWWWSPVEANLIKKPNMENKYLTYRDLTHTNAGEVELKTFEELSSDIMCWLNYYQLVSQFKEDMKKRGFNKVKSEFELLLRSSDSKLLSKMYKLLLNYEMADEAVKETVIKWARNLRQEIIDQWQTSLKSGIKFTCSYNIKENVYKMCTKLIC